MWVKKGQRAAAMRFLTKALDSYPEHPGLNYLMGKCFYLGGNYSMARFYLVRAVRYEKDNIVALGMLEKVEEYTGNYSSAICYINDMLVLTPYDKALWLKKIGLYRKQGNTTEANQLLKRLAQLFPNDQDVKNRYSGQLEENMKTFRKNDRSDLAIDAMRELVYRNPHNVDYCLQLVNLLLQTGQSDEALNTCAKGISQNPSSTDLAKKKAEILAEKHRYNEADDFLKDFVKHHPDGRLVTLQHQIEEDAAQDALKNDPYVMYGRIYERTHSADALRYLMNTAVSRGYVSDALYYIGIARKTRPNDVTLLWKEYTVYQQSGDRQHAKSLLQRIVTLQPRNRDAVDALSAYKMEDATGLMAGNEYSEALPLLDFVIRNSADREQLLGAFNKKYTCLFETKQYNEAKKLLVQMNTRFPHSQVVSRRSFDLMAAQGFYPEALSMLAGNLNAETGGDSRAYALSEYEEIALKYIRQLQGQGAVRKALSVADSLLLLVPSSRQGLLYAINNAALLKDSVRFDTYCRQAADLYPADVGFKVKLASSYQRQRKYKSALDLLQPALFYYSNDSSLIGAFSENSLLFAASCLRRHQAREAVGALDTALVYDSGNRSLLYEKGLAYEALHEYDSAHFYQKFYQPSLLEAQGFEFHLEQLQQKNNANFITVSYRTSRYGDNDVRTSTAAIEYSRRRSKNTFSFRLNYAGRDGDTQTNAETYSPGGTGVQLMGRWEHAFGDNFSMAGDIAAASRYFPSLAVNFQVDRTFGQGWTANLHTGYRNVSSYARIFKYDELYHSWFGDGWNKTDNNMVNLGAGLQKTWAAFALGGKVDVINYASSLHYSAVVNAAYYPVESRILTVSTVAAISNAPQTEMLDAALPGTFDKTNTTVGIGIAYQLVHNISLSVNGTWSTFTNTLAHRDALPVEVNGVQTYNANNYQDVYESSYKNLFSIDSSLVIGF